MSNQHQYVGCVHPHLQQSKCLHCEFSDGDMHSMIEKITNRQYYELPENVSMNEFENLSNDEQSFYDTTIKFYKKKSFNLLQNIPKKSLFPDILEREYISIYEWNILSFEDKQQFYPIDESGHHTIKVENIIGYIKSETPNLNRLANCDNLKFFEWNSLPPHMQQRFIEFPKDGFVQKSIIDIEEKDADPKLIKDPIKISKMDYITISQYELLSPDIQKSFIKNYEYDYQLQTLFHEGWIACLINKSSNEHHKQIFRENYIDKYKYEKLPANLQQLFKPTHFYNTDIICGYYKIPTANVMQQISQQQQIHSYEYDSLSQNLKKLFESQITYDSFGRIENIVYIKKK